VSVMVEQAASDPAETVGQLTGQVAQASGGKKVGMEVTSPTGAAYVGKGVKGDSSETIILRKTGSDIVIVIYAPTAEMAPVAERLAGNVGNGDGLNDYPDTEKTLWVLPPTSPPGFTLVEVTALTPEDLGVSMAELEAEGTDGRSADTARLMEQVRRLMPERLMVARWTDDADAEYQTVACEYPSSARAWGNWLLLRGALGASGAGSASALGGQGMFFTEGDTSVLMARKGPWLVFTSGPAKANAGRLADLIDSLQL